MDAPKVHTPYHFLQGYARRPKLIGEEQLMKPISAGYETRKHLKINSMKWGGLFLADR
jgi:hypothetical protein